MLLIVASLLTGLAVHLIWLFKTKGIYKLSEKILREANLEAQKTVDQAYLKAKELELENKYLFEAKQQELLSKLEKKESELKAKSLLHEQNLKKYEQTKDKLKKQEEQQQLFAKQLELKEQQLQKQNEDLLHSLSSIKNLSLQEAEALFFSEVEKKYRAQGLTMASSLIKEAQEKSMTQVESAIATALQRIDLEKAEDLMTCAIKIPRRDYKKRIVGREGKNIRTFEKITGVDLLMDDLPDSVVISSLDPLKKEIAKQSLQSLLKDGRIHPTRIESVVAQVSLSMKQEILSRGKQAAEKCLVSNLKDSLLNYLGQLSFRYSKGQNILSHSQEVSCLMGMMAAELGLDESVSRRIGLLHDIGKALSQDHEGSHALAGAELALNYGESQQVANGIASHHNEVPFETTEAYLCQVADRLSGGKPGARKELLEHSIKRAEMLEKIALQFPEIEKAHVLKAGKELVIILNPLSLAENQMHGVASDLVEKIEKQIPFSGKIKITVIREKQTTYFAR